MSLFDELTQGLGYKLKAKSSAYEANYIRIRRRYMRPCPALCRRASATTPRTSAEVSSRVHGGLAFKRNGFGSTYAVMREDEPIILIEVEEGGRDS